MSNLVRHVQLNSVDWVDATRIQIQKTTQSLPIHSGVKENPLTLRNLLYSN